MSFKSQNKEKETWKNWLVKNRSFIADSHLPENILKSKKHWEDFLLHGYLDHYPDENNFVLEDLLSESQENLLKFLKNELNEEEKQSFVVFKLLSEKD